MVKHICRHHIIISMIVHQKSRKRNVMPPKNRNNNNNHQHHRHLQSIDRYSGRTKRAHDYQRLAILPLASKTKKTKRVWNCRYDVSYHYPHHHRQNYHRQCTLPWMNHSQQQPLGIHHGPITIPPADTFPLSSLVSSSSLRQCLDDEPPLRLR